MLLRLLLLSAVQPPTPHEAAVGSAGEKHPECVKVRKAKVLNPGQSLGARTAAAALLAPDPFGVVAAIAGLAGALGSPALQSPCLIYSPLAVTSSDHDASLKHGIQGRFRRQLA